MRRLLLTPLLLALAGPSCKRTAPAAAPDAGTPVLAPAAALDVPVLLEGLAGEVQVERGDAGTPAVAGPLRDGDTLRTGAGAGVTLRLPDGRRVEVGPGARLRVRAGEGRVELEVLEGVVLSRTPGAGSGALQLSVRTSGGLARVGAGSELQVVVAGDETRVEVQLGEVELLGASGERTRAGAGEVLRVTAGRVEVVARERRVLALAPLQVTVRAEGAGTQLRRQGAAAWRTLGLGDAEALQPGDGVRTAAAPARLALQGSDSTLLLQGRTELTFVGAGQGAGQGAESALDEARVELRRGALGLQAAPGRRGRLVLPELTVESESGGGLSFERSEAGLTVAAHTGGATLVRGEARQPLRAGERVRISRAAQALLEIEPVPRAPVQLGAQQGAQPLQLFHPGLSEVTLTWDAEVPPGGVQVEVAADAAFTRPVLAGRVEAPFVNVPAPARGQLHWRVTGTDGQRLAGGSARLAPEPRQRPLARLRNEVPEGTERTTIFYQDRPPAVTFTWEPSASAARYQVAVYRDGELERPVAERSVTEPRAALEAGVLGEGRFLWSVAPLSAGGAVLRGGRMNKLELVYDNSVPGLMLSAPRNGARAGRGPVWVEGVAPVGSTLSVNGQPLTLDAKGRFRARVRPTGQPPLLLFMMTRPDAPAVLTVRRLR